MKHRFFSSSVLKIRKHRRIKKQFQFHTKSVDGCGRFSSFLNPSRKIKKRPRIEKQFQFHTKSFDEYERSSSLGGKIRKKTRIKKKIVSECWDGNLNKACKYCSCKPAPPPPALDKKAASNASKEQPDWVRRAIASQLELEAVPPEPPFRAICIKAAELEAYSRHPDSDHNEDKVQKDVSSSVEEEIRRHDQAKRGVILARRDSKTLLSLRDNKTSRKFDPEGLEKRYVAKRTWLKHGSGLFDFLKTKTEGVAEEKKSETREGDNNHMTVRLTGVTIFPQVDGQGGDTMAGFLEAHVDRFTYTTSSSYLCSQLTYDYENVKEALFQAEDEWDKMLPLLHLRLHHPIRVGTEKIEHIQFHLVPTAVEPDNDSEKFEKEKQTKGRSRDLKDFVARVRNMWEGSLPPFQFCEVCKWKEFRGVLPFKKVSNIFFLTFSSLLQLSNTPFSVVNLEEIEIVNLTRLRPKEVDMTVVFNNFKCPVLQISSIPIESLEDIKRCLNFWGVKFYDNKVDLNWNSIVKKIADDPETFIQEGGWDAYGLEDSVTSLYYRHYHLELSQTAVLIKGSH